MKLNCAHENRARAGAGAALKHTCRVSCRKARAQIQAAKDAMFAESSNALHPQERLLRLALNEAEALAWETKYPQLVFPTLATEKVQAVIAWNRRQQARHWEESVSIPDWRPDRSPARTRETTFYHN
jgi:hypothetical protein